MWIYNQMKKWSLYLFVFFFFCCFILKYGNKPEGNCAASRTVNSRREAFILKVNLGYKYFRCLFTWVIQNICHSLNMKNNLTYIYSFRKFEFQIHIPIVDSSLLTTSPSSPYHIQLWSSDVCYLNTFFLWPSLILLSTLLPPTFHIHSLLFTLLFLSSLLLFLTFPSICLLCWVFSVEFHTEYSYT